MNRLKLAVIGAGHLGRIHARLLTQANDVDLVAIADPVADARAELSETLGVDTTSDYRELLGQIEAAIIATPTVTHFDIARHLLSLGIHAFVEKPITFDSATGRELATIAARSQTVLQVGHVERFNPAWRVAQQYIDAPRYVELRRTSGYTFRSTDIGVVLDLMIHDIDLALSMASSKLMRVDSFGQIVLGGHEDIAHARLEFADGLVVRLMASRTSMTAERTAQVFCDSRVVNVDLGQGTLDVVQYDEALQQDGFDVQALSAEEIIHFREHLFETLLRHTQPVVPAGNAIADEHADFARAIWTGTSPQVDGLAGAEALVVAEQILHQIHTTAADHVLRGPNFVPHGYDIRRAG